MQAGDCDQFALWETGLWLGRSIAGWEGNQLRKKQRLRAAAAGLSRSPAVIQLRPFRRADLETLYRIDQICFAPEIAYSQAELRYYVQHPKSFTVVAETEAGTIAGFCTARLHTREGVLFGHIITIDVVPEERR